MILRIQEFFDEKKMETKIIIEWKSYETLMEEWKLINKLVNGTIKFTTHFQNLIQRNPQITGSKTIKLSTNDKT